MLVGEAVEALRGEGASADGFNFVLDPAVARQLSHVFASLYMEGFDEVIPRKR